MDQLFVTSQWRKSPSLFDQPVIDLRQDDFDFKRVQSLIADLRRQDIIYRNASGGVDALMSRLEPVDYSKDGLEVRLAGETTSLMLQNINEYDSVYRDVLSRFVDWIASTLEVRRSDIHRPSASFFLSSPHAISSYHTDREQNFLFQLRGRKIVHVFPRRTGLVDEMGIAIFRRRRGIHTEYRPEMEADVQLFSMDPGNTLYIPRMWPHWVDNGDQVSLSLSLSFLMLPDLAWERFYNANNRLRKLFMGGSSRRLDGSTG